MRFAGQFICGLAVWLVAGGSGWAQDASANPYVPIVERNIFNLVPMPSTDPADAKPVDPPPKITPNGIMSLFGQVQVLFKVAEPGKAGKPAEDQSYVMSEGERQDDIEVTKIDALASIITFNNHGVIQELPLSNVPDVSTPDAAPTGGPGFGRRPGFPGGGPRFGGGRNPGNPSTGNNPSYGGNPNTSATPNSGTANVGGNNGYNPQSQSQNDLSPEALALLMEKNRIDTQDLVNQGLMPPLPPTPITPADAKGVGGVPLVAGSDNGPPALPNQVESEQ